MSDLNRLERNKLEIMFDMKLGDILGFDSRSFRDFFRGYGIDIDAESYRVTLPCLMSSWMTVFWILAPNYIVGNVIEG
ncbi:hypothetical protein [Cephaloticoccus primus]|nr:hypothetical protein [Cephaloticoccus primus]